MSATTIIAVAILGGAGACLRVLVSAPLNAASADPLPVGTLAVNLAGALLAGVLVGAGVGDGTQRLLGAALLGSLTTFSTLIAEAGRLSREEGPRLGAAYLALSLALGIPAAGAGIELGGGL